MKSRRAVLGLAAAAATHFVLADRHRVMAAVSDYGLKARIASDGDALGIDYQFTNGGTGPVLVTNKIWRMIDGKAKIDPDFVYANVNSDGLLAIFKTMPAIPEKKSPTNLVAPYMTRVESGQSLTESISLPLPLLPFMEYSSNEAAVDNDGNKLVQTVKEAAFGLAFFVPPEGSKIWNEKAFGESVDLFHNPPGKRAQYGVLWSQRFKVSVPVYRRAAE
jgi:hypothetical protein